MTETCPTRTVLHRGRLITRPTRYRRTCDPDDLPPWGVAIVRLWKWGYTAPQIAEIVAELSASSIRQLEDEGAWNRDTITPLLHEDAGKKLSVQMVKHHLRRMGLTKEDRDPRCLKEAVPIPTLKQIEHARRVVAMGWGHCLPITISQARILDLLYCLGPCSRRQIEERTGLVLDKSKAGRASPLHRLMWHRTVTRDDQRVTLAPLVIVSMEWPNRRYSLAPGVDRRNVAILQQRQQSFISWYMSERG